jgi:hypothetical protein
MEIKFLCVFCATKKTMGRVFTGLNRVNERLTALGKLSNFRGSRHI